MYSLTSFLKKGIELSENNKIFVQIASYRDPQLIPTITDLLDNAKFPENITFGIAWQHNKEDKWDDLSSFFGDHRFKIIDIDHNDALGVCWARNLVQQLYDDEQYTLQIDSHMRFAKDWDETLINEISKLKLKGYNKPLLTGYVPSFDPENDPNGRVQAPWRMVFDRFTPEGVVFFLPEEIPNYKDINEPVPARFYSAHFCFTLGSFSKEVQHDPNYYFHGEEISIAARAYTHGYDLFHPHQVVVWHEYTRKGRSKHWDDNGEWWKRNKDCHLRNRKLFEMDGETRDIDFGIYGFGKERTLRDYEIYAGILFSKRAIQQHTIEKKYPPNPFIENEEEWLKSFSIIFKHCIDIQYSDVPENDYDFWVVSFKDDQGKEIYRKDADEQEIKRMKLDPDNYCKVWREFQTVKQPKSWIVWPHSRSKGWCKEITGFLG